ncbi:Maf family protein [Desertimonas flava]|uniref:Maf family protein n=1 Tax=Desertimonas flava TaxID=2064846 RepID=UPI001D0C5776|nr:Maf family protein [Desertimonas flava]
MTLPHPAVAALTRPLILASGSPRRRELLAQLGAEFRVEPPDVDETPRPGEAAVDLVRRLGHDKATAIATARPDAVVVAADSVVDVDGVVLGKPGSDDEARKMLRLLSGRWHHVHTGVSVAAGGQVRTEVVSTSVEMTAFGAEQIDWYVGTREPHDKAGAYAIQGHGGAFVTRIEGSTSNVVGLPLAELVALLAALTTWLPAGRR